MSSVQRRETRVTGGNWRRLSLMHMVVKGSWVRSSLGSVEWWVTWGIRTRSGATTQEICPESQTCPNFAHMHLCLLPLNPSMHHVWP